jgi:outer membrane protein assembly factor BamB
MNRLIGVLFCVVFLSSCSSLWNDEVSDSPSAQDSEKVSFDDSVFDDSSSEDDEEINNKPKDLESIEATIKIKKVWRQSVGASNEVYQPTLHPAVGDGVVYAASNKGRISAWPVEKGKRLWRTDLNMSLSGGVGLGAGLVAVGSTKGELVVLDAETGEERWRVNLSSEILSAPAAQDDLLVAQTQDGKIYGLSVTTGEEIWRYTVEVPVLSLRGTAGPVVTPRMVITGFANGKLVALSAATGSLLWEAKLATGEGKSELDRMVDVNSPILGDEVVYATSYQGRAGAFSRGTGRELWAQDSSSFHPPAFASGRLFVVDTVGQVLRLRSSGGRAEWTNTDLLRRGLTPPLVVGDYVMVADSEGYLHALSQADGSIVGRVKVDGDGVAVGMVTDGTTLFVQDKDDDLTAYQLIVK